MWTNLFIILPNNVPESGTFCFFNVTFDCQGREFGDF